MTLASIGLSPTPGCGSIGASGLRPRPPSLEIAWKQLAATQRELAAAQQELAATQQQVAEAREEARLADMQRDDYREQLAAEEGRVVRSTLRAVRQRLMPATHRVASGRRTGSILYNIDRPIGRIVSNPIVIAGWAVDLATSKAPDIRICIGNTVAQAERKNRPDVVEHLAPQRHVHEALGFEVTVEIAPGEVSAAIEFLHAAGGWKLAWQATLMVHAPLYTTAPEAKQPARPSEDAHDTRAS